MTLTRRLLLASAAVPLLAHAETPEPKPWPASRPTPALKLAAWEAQPFDLAAVRGQVVLLNFWASWCEPCRAEMPSLELLAERHAKDRLTVQCINYRETDAAVQRYLAQYPVSLPILRDRDGAVAKEWQVRIFPTTIAIGRDGRAAFTVTGEVDWGGPEARRWIAKLL